MYFLQSAAGVIHADAADCGETLALSFDVAATAGALTNTHTHTLSVPEGVSGEQKGMA